MHSCYAHQPKNAKRLNVCTSWKQCSKHENLENSATDLHIHQWDDTCEGQLESDALFFYCMLCTVFT